MVTLGPPSGFEAPSAPPVPASNGEEWRTEGSVLLGLDLLRSVGEGAAQTQVRAKVIGWLPKEESDYLDNGGKPAALYRIRYVEGELRGDEEDLEEDDIRGSVPTAGKVALAEREQILFEEGNGAKPPSSAPVEEDEKDDEGWVSGAEFDEEEEKPEPKKKEKGQRAASQVYKPATGGRWTAADSLRLKEAYDQSPSNWTIIAKGFDGRTPGSCRDRFRTMYGLAKPEKHNGAPVGLALPRGGFPKPRGRTPQTDKGEPATWDPMKGEWLGVTRKAAKKRPAKPASAKKPAPAPKPRAPKKKDVVPLTTAETAAVLHAIARLDGQATQKKVRRMAESTLGAPEGSLDDKKAAVKEVCRKEVTRLEAAMPPPPKPSKKKKKASPVEKAPPAKKAKPAGAPPSMASLLPASAGGGASAAGP